MKARALATVLALGLALSGLALTGCTTDATCFGSNCPDEDGNLPPGTGSGTGGSAASGGTSMQQDGGGGSGIIIITEAGTCELTNGGNEICDELDNNCNGTVDEGYDMSEPQTCGICDNNCYHELINVEPTSISCSWSGVPDEAGECSFTQCAADYWDLEPSEPGCEYYCVKSADDDTECNNRDDDCDGDVDEDVDVCTDTSNCGTCGANCVVVHGTPECVHTGTDPCDPSNTQCEILACDDDDQDGSPDWWDVDGVYATGCEYPCQLTDGGAGKGVEVCGDALDNDCDGKIDALDDLSGDPQIGIPCYGDPDGICHEPTHAGLTECQGAQIVCVGPNVLKENDVAETCNDKDDDCDGQVDDNPTDAGGACGPTTTYYPCMKGTWQCNSGGNLECIGAVYPAPQETCNTLDDDCDGEVDATAGQPPPDSVGPCLPTGIYEPPPGATSPCHMGNLACVGGAPDCINWGGPPQANDTCGVDANCNGVLENQPDLSSDPNYCGNCQTDCYADPLSGHTIITCEAGTCTFQGCQPGWYDIDQDQICEYPCIFTGAEQCDNADNDCDGTVDNNIASTPSPAQICGVSPAATTPECTTGVAVTCNGSWQCTFTTPNVCDPDCSSQTELCDGLDNNCDGGVDEVFPELGQTCYSDDGLPAPGHGACRQSGQYVCNGLSATECNAVKGSCSPNCEEKCDGVDNDCDGLVDEHRWNPDGSDGWGPDSAYYVKPATVKLGSANLWVFAYEASRPDATSMDSGSGNGYWYSSNPPPSSDVAPSGVTLDMTPACSVPGQIPWFNVTPREVEHACHAIGGFICPTTNWKTACQAGAGCTWGYVTSCNSGQDGSRYCNLAAFDYDPQTSGVQHGLLPVGEVCGSQPCLENCWADWGSNGDIFDITGNLREITRESANTFPLLGGAFNSSLESSAVCDFDFYVVGSEFALYDTGFRCCFDKNPG